MANAPKIYDFPMEKVEDTLVSFLRKKRGESTVADMIAGTGLPKYQVEQAAKRTLDEYAGRLKATESGELLYYFPDGMRSTVHGLGPSMRRFWKGFVQGSLKVLSFLFKIWIVAMLVGYFVAFVALVVLAIVASFAASMANRSDNRGGGGRDRGGGGFGGMYLVIQLLDLILRMWFWSNILGSQRRKPQKQGRAFYKSVFGFVFGEGDPNKGWEDDERRYIISYIRSHKGVITLEELMALTGRESDEANTVMNRILLEYEGEPGVTDNGTVVYAFPELMRTSQGEQKSLGQVPLLNPSSKRLYPFSANKRRTNGWILFFNAFNLAFGAYFLVNGLTRGADLIWGKTGPFLYSFTGNLLQHAGIGSPALLMAIILGAIPVAFSIVFFIVPWLRKINLDRRNVQIREEILRRRILTQVLSSPARVDPSELRPVGNGLDPRNLPAVSKRIVDRLAASMGAEPLVKDKEGTFAYRFSEIERQVADLEDYRRKIDLKNYEVGKTIFDSGN